MEHRVKSDIFIIGSQWGCEGSCPDGLTPGQPSHSSVLRSQVVGQRQEEELLVPWVASTGVNTWGKDLTQY